MPDRVFVLVVEDETMIRLPIVDTLTDEGFQVMEAGHAEAALTILKSHAPGIHVLFPDIQMPGSLDGLALAQHTSRHWPWIRLLVTSGQQCPCRAAFPKGSRFVSKPYKQDHVISHLRELAAA
jgi:two-component system, response regulator PdtaR